LIDWNDVAHRSNGAAAQHLPPISRAAEQDWAKALMQLRAEVVCLESELEAAKRGNTPQEG